MKAITVEPQRAKQQCKPGHPVEHPAIKRPKGVRGPHQMNDHERRRDMSAVWKIAAHGVTGERYGI